MRIRLKSGGEAANIFPLGTSHPYEIPADRHINLLELVAHGTHKHNKPHALIKAGPVFLSFQSYSLRVVSPPFEVAFPQISPSETSVLLLECSAISLWKLSCCSAGSVLCLPFIVVWWCFHGIDLYPYPSLPPYHQQLNSKNVASSLSIVVLYVL